MTIVYSLMHGNIFKEKINTKKNIEHIGIGF